MMLAWSCQSDVMSFILPPRLKGYPYPVIHYTMKDKRTKEEVLSEIGAELDDGYFGKEVPHEIMQGSSSHPLKWKYLWLILFSAILISCVILNVFAMEEYCASLQR